MYIACSIQDREKRRDIEQYLSRQSELKQMLNLVSEFKTLLTGGDENKLDEWIKKAENIKNVNIPCRNRMFIV